MDKVVLTRYLFFLKNYRWLYSKCVTINISPLKSYDNRKMVQGPCRGSAVLLFPTTNIFRFVRLVRFFLSHPVPVCVFLQLPGQQRGSQTDLNRRYLAGTRFLALQRRSNRLEKSPPGWHHPLWSAVVDSRQSGTRLVHRSLADAELTRSEGRRGVWGGATQGGESATTGRGLTRLITY